ncbi:MAG: DoxX family protein [Verrucomicrobiaceae bacterium]|nr:MAG: DoxX family protein [Verrucomicrobiaceae bacterium]
MKTQAQRIYLASIGLRVALALSFLSAVADRFGLWGAPGAANVAWGNFPAFLDYTGLLLPMVPKGLVPIFGWMATIGEVVLALGLLAGWRVRWFAFGSAVLLFSFAASMTVALGVEPAFSYSVWTAGMAAVLLAAVSGAEKEND